MTTAAKLVLETVQALLQPLEPGERDGVLIELAVLEAAELQAVRKQLDDARENAAEWRRRCEDAAR